MRAFLIFCVAMIVLGYCSQAMASEPRVWLLYVCSPDGKFCQAYMKDMVPHRYATKTACDLDAVTLAVPSGYRVMCGREPG